MKLSEVFEEYPDQEELIWQFVGQSDFENLDFSIQKDSIEKFATSKIMNNYRKNAKSWQKQLVKQKMEDLEGTKKIPIIVSFNEEEPIMVDGNHRLIALALAGEKEVLYIDLGEDI